MLTSFSQQPEAIELGKRSCALNDVAIALHAGRFNTALVLRMHRTQSTGRSVASLANVDERRIDQLQLTPGKVAEAVMEATRIKAYDLIVAGFELHHLAKEEEFRTAQAIGDALSAGGAFVTFDYALRNDDAAKIAPYIRGEREKQNVEAYGGIDNWLPAHAGWNEERLGRLARNAERRFSFSRGLPAHAGISAASDDLELIDALQTSLAKYDVTPRS